MPCPLVTRRPAASLIELLVVVGVLGVLVGLTASAVQAVRGAAARLSCANNLRQIAIAAQNYESAHGALPPGYDWWPADRPPAILVPWPLVLLPDLDHGPLWASARAAYRQERYGIRRSPHVGLATVVKVYACPADGRTAGPITDADGWTAAYLSYAGVAGGGVALNPVNGAARPDGAMGTLKTGTRLTGVTDGTSQTLLYGERPPGGLRLANNWYTATLADPGWQADGYNRGTVLMAQSDEPANVCRPPFRFGPGRVDNRCDTHHFWSLHPGGANFALCDGSVRFLAYSAADLLPAMATRASGEVVALPD